MTAMRKKDDQHKPPTERQIQIQCVSWFRQRYPQVSDLFFSVPNGGARNAWTAKNLKDEGALAGVADLILLVPRHGYASLCIEMKKPGGRLSEAQKRFKASAEAFLSKYVVCYSFEEFKAVVEDFLEN